MLCLAASLAASSASAGGLHPEFGLGVNRLLGLGLRAAGGLQLLQGHEVGTGRIDYYLYGRQGNRECDELGNLFQRRSL